MCTSVVWVERKQKKTKQKRKEKSWPTDPFFPDMLQETQLFFFSPNHSKICKKCDGMANSLDPDQTVPSGAVWSGSTLFAQTCLSENQGALQFLHKG